MTVRSRYGAREVFFVVAVGDTGHGRTGLRGEFLLHQRRASEHGGALVQHGLFLPPELAPGESRHREVFQVIHPGPGVAEIRNPGNAGGSVQFLADQMHGMRWTGGNYHIYRILFQIFTQPFHGRAYPTHPRVRHKEIGADPQGQFLFPAFLAAGDFGHFRAFSAREFAVSSIGLPDGAPQHLHGGGNLGGERVVQRGIIGIPGCKDNGLPAIGRQIFHEFHPALYPRSSGRRPIIGYDEHALHRLQRYDFFTTFAI